jgi:hypothetical protein
MKDDNLPSVTTLANSESMDKFDDYRDTQSFVIESVNSEDEYDHKIRNNILESEQQSLVNK